MAIRISTSQTFMQGTNAILDNQYKVATNQLQLATGKKILKPSDNPIGTAVAMNLRQQIDNANQYISNGQSVETRLNVQENTLDNVTDILGRIRDLTLQAANGAMSYQDREAIAIEIEKRYAELLGLANTQLASGEYIFGGFRSDAVPFVRDATGTVHYNGDQGVQLVNVNSMVQVESGNSGDAVFMNIRTGNGAFLTTGDRNNTGTGVISTATLSDPVAYVGDVYTIQFINNGGRLEYQITGANTGDVFTPPLPQFDEDGQVTFNGITYSISGVPADGDTFTVQPSHSQDIFTTLNQLVSALRLPADDSAAQATFIGALNVGMQNLDQAIKHIEEVRASVGTRLNVVESERNINESLVVESKSALSLIEDLDYAEAIMEMNKRLLALQAAQQSFVKIQNLSLFEFI